MLLCFLLLMNCWDSPPYTSLSKSHYIYVKQIHLQATRIHIESCSSDTDEDVAWSFGFLTTSGKYLVTFQVIRPHTPVSLLPLCSSSSYQTEIGKCKLKVPTLSLDLHTVFPYWNLTSHESYLGDYLAGSTVEYLDHSFTQSKIFEHDLPEVSMIKFHVVRTNNNYIGINSFHSLGPQDSETFTENRLLSL